MIEVIGWVGAICFSLSAAPQAWQCYKQKHSNGINSFMLLLWLIGEISTLIYVISKSGFEQTPLITNYVLNFMLLLVIIYYKLRSSRYSKEGL